MKKQENVKNDSKIFPTIWTNFTAFSMSEVGREEQRSHRFQYQGALEIWWLNIIGDPELAYVFPGTKISSKLLSPGESQITLRAC